MNFGNYDASTYPSAYDAARSTATRVGGSPIQHEQRLGDALAWHFGTAGHGYVGAYVPGLAGMCRLWEVLSSIGGPFIWINKSADVLVGEEDCSWALVVYVADAMGNKVPEKERETAIETMYRWYPDARDRIDAVLADTPIPA